MIVMSLLDANYNFITGKTVTLSASPGSHATINPASGISSLKNGAVAFTITDATVEDVTFTAMDTTDNLTLTQTAAVNFTGPPAASGGISANPTSVTADGTSTTTVAVTLHDAQGNPSPGKLVSLSQGDGSSVVSDTTGSTDSTGTVDFKATDTILETVTYTATDITDGNLPVPGSATVNSSILLARRPAILARAPPRQVLW